MGAVVNTLISLEQKKQKSDLFHFTTITEYK